MVDLKQLVTQWKLKSLHRRQSFHYSYSDDCNCNNNVVNVHNSNDKNRCPPSGCVSVFVGTERERFTIPVRFLNLHIFKCLLGEAAEEFGLEVKGGLVFPCEIVFFKEILKHVKKDEHKYGRYSLEEFQNMIFNSYEEKSFFPLTPLLQKTSCKCKFTGFNAKFRSKSAKEFKYLSSLYKK
ncbi:unnamed protein product [Trifolium pratense]|uniref:Uncharacterized protein n=1 Tax=Trifolium pratense TaxID=57577 RepID=A0ACB0M6X6_TRIPR|nr:unnamed protein product [Trifolium pratense]